jgi:hypothetical protein
MNLLPEPRSHGSESGCGSVLEHSEAGEPALSRDLMPRPGQASD